VQQIQEPADETHSTILALGMAIEQRDDHTGTHCYRLAYLGVALGQRLGLEQESLVSLYRGGYLHDVGKVAIPDAILNKPGKLTETEWNAMRSHTTRGEAICRHVKSLAPVLPIIRNHHERWDGSGYPDGLKGKSIPLLARVLQVVDIYDALTNPRPYHEACAADEALEILSGETDRGWRDPDVVYAFLSLHGDLFPRQATQETARTSLMNLDRSIRRSFASCDGVLLPSRAD
jgi:putative two-component system response regulator